MHEHIPVYSHHLGSAIDLYWHALVPLHAHAARSCRAQCPQAPPAPHQAGRLGSTGVHRRAAHLFACLEGKGGPGHCVAAAPGVWRNRQSWPSVSCWTNSELQVWTIQFRHMGEGITCLTPADYTARLEGKLPRAVSSAKIVHGPASMREIFYSFDLSSPMHPLSSTSCYFGEGNKVYAPLPVSAQPPYH